MKLTTKGQVTVPKHVREFLKISAHSEIEFLIHDGKVVVVKSQKNTTASDDQDESRFAAFLGSKTNGPSSDEWMAATRGDS